MKTITFAVPCYNSAEYMDACIESLLAVGDDVEVIIVNDGSSDGTAAKADSWQERYPDIVCAVHQENGGHGAAVNAGLEHAHGRYFKVVDSDDWLDVEAMAEVMGYLREQMEYADPTDLVIANYVYEKVHENARTVMRYKNVFPVAQEFTWDDVGTFNPSQYLLMHSVIYRTDLLRDAGLELPRHCFYVDNIFVYQPLPCVQTLYYLDVDMYRYFIGREDQSVNESVMLGRLDQQLRVTRIMIDTVDVEAIENKRLRHYMENYLSMMMTICSIFLRMRNQPGDKEALDGIWEYLRDADPALYRRVRLKVLNLGANLPTELGRRIGIGGYHVAQRIFKFN
ncbi:MAG: glycosyltransferase [Eggerthellaceae bacterium]|jgi:glycosyltransferase involved in cell wall biosynthesis|nr:glycosyltransferase [Eggerthellaceae bacterium]